MDTSVLAYTAEDLIAHTLQRAGILVAKPRFDHDGADLLGLLAVADGAKFCRIQCKGRTLTNDRNTSVAVKQNYVTPGLVVFLFVETGTRDETHLYCFFEQEMRTRWKSSGSNFRLTIRRSALKKLDQFRVDDVRVLMVKSVIENANSKQELGKLIVGTMNAIEEGHESFQAVGTVASSK